MRSPPRRSPDLRAHRRSPTTRASAELSLPQIERRFAKFRREHPPQTRIPDTLRSAALAAMRQGVTPAQLRRCCSLSSKQLELWQQSQARLPADADRAAVQDARVFCVVDDVPAPNREPDDPDADHQLELRLEGWSICLRRVDR